MLKKEKYPSHNTVSYLFICISMLKKETLYPSHNTVSYLFIYDFVEQHGGLQKTKEEMKLRPATATPHHSKLFIYLQGSPNQAKWAKFSPYVSWNHSHSLQSEIKVSFCKLLLACK